MRGFQLCVNVSVQLHNVLNKLWWKVHVCHCFFYCPIWNWVKCFCKVNVKNMKFFALFFGKRYECCECINAVGCFFFRSESILWIWKQVVLFSKNLLFHLWFSLTESFSLVISSMDLDFYGGPCGDLYVVIVLCVTSQDETVLSFRANVWVNKSIYLSLTFKVASFSRKIDVDFSFDIVSIDVKKTSIFVFFLKPVDCDPSTCV